MMSLPRKKLGTSSLEVFPLVLGGNVFGWSADETTSFQVLDAYVAAGGNAIDTADSYSFWVPGNQGGESESIIGRWLATRGDRDSLVIATKVSNHPEYRGLSPMNIKAAAEASLRRLGTDHLDLYYTHFDDPSVPVEEIIAALDALVREGKVREIAASNISPERLQASLAFSEREGMARYVALQPHYNLMERGTFEGGAQDLALRHQLGVLPYFALASGFLTGKHRRGIAAGTARAGYVGKYAGAPRGERVLAELTRVAQARGASLATVALAWLAAQPSIVAPIASARTLQQLPDLLAVAELHLTSEEVAALSAASQ
ncbi:aldo/keto reductase [Streptomyces achromogenes]